MTIRHVLRATLRARDTAASVAGRPYGRPRCEAKGRLHTAADRPGEGSTEPVSPDPLASVAVLGGFRFVPGSVLPGSTMECESNMLPFDVRHPSRDALASFGECAVRSSNEPKLNLIVRSKLNQRNGWREMRIQQPHSLDGTAFDPRPAGQGLRRRRFWRRPQRRWPEPG